MIAKDFDAITKQDIDALVTNSVAEGRTIEYKQQLPGGTDDEKREFLADVSSFANAGGGDLIYGIVEKRDIDNKPTGIPEKAEGLPGISADGEIRRLDEVIRSSIDPRIPGYRIRALDGFASGPVLLIRVPRSWASPHMVTFKNLSRFFSRTSAGKYQLDVSEIRSAFTASGDMRSKITAFRAERLGRIVANDGPVRLPESAKLVLHLVPLSILDPVAHLDLQPLNSDPNLAAPMQNTSYAQRFNLDGFLGYGPRGQDGVWRGYVQVFRSGAFEAVDAGDFSQRDGTKLIPSILVEQRLLNATARYCNASQQLGVPLPLVLMVTIYGFKGFAMATGSPWQSRYGYDTIDRDLLQLPDVLVEDFSTPADILLRPVFDAFWQSAGFPSCEHYNKQGRYDGGQSKLPGGPG